MANNEHRPKLHSPRNKKLSPLDRMDIVQRKDRGESVQDLAKEYGVTVRTIRNQ